MGVASAAIIAAAAHAAPAATIVSSVADYEPRQERGRDDGNWYFNDLNDGSSTGTGTGNIDIPSDAGEVRVGGQNHHKYSAAYFFPLPQSSEVASVDAAHFAVSQIEDTSATDPTFNADLWAVGIYSNIAVANDFDDPKVNPTIGEDGLASLLHNDADTDTRAGLNTSVPRTKIADNFIAVGEHLDPGGGSALFETSGAEDAALLAYLTELYNTTTIGPDAYLVLRVSPDATPNGDATNRYRLASASNGTAGVTLPTLTLETTPVPEPAGLALLALGAAGLLARRRDA